MFDDFLGDLFSTVTDVAVSVAPYALPAAAAYGATRLLGGTSKEGLLAAGVAGATSGLMRNMGGSSAGTTGALGKAGVASGPISGAPTAGTAGTASITPSSAVQPGQGAKPGILDRLGMEGTDLLKFGGQIISSLDDTDDKFRERALDIREREHRVDPVSWTPRTMRVNDPDDVTRRRVI